MRSPHCSGEEYIAAAFFSLSCGLFLWMIFRFWVFAYRQWSASSRFMDYLHQAHRVDYEYVYRGTLQESWGAQYLAINRRRFKEVTARLKIEDSKSVQMLQELDEANRRGYQALLDFFIAGGLWVLFIIFVLWPVLYLHGCL